MSIEFRCSQCNQLLRVPETSVGRNARCPKCRALMQVPETAVESTADSLAAPERLTAANPFADPEASAPKREAARPSDNPYASPAGAAYAFDPVPAAVKGERPGLPWENRPQSFATWWETTKLCLLQPTLAFSQMKQYGGMAQPMMHSAIGMALGVVGQMLWYVPLIVVMGVAVGGPANSRDILIMVGLQIASQLVFGLVGVILSSTIGLLVAAAIGHVCLMLVGGARQGYETTLRVIGYAQGATSWLNVIPAVGGLIGMVWMIVLEIIGLARAHEIEIGKAVLAVLLPIIFCAVLSIVLVALFFAVFGAALAGAGR